MSKIALIGTAPSSVRLAPYADCEWKIWACSPGAAPVVPRADAWFELHYIHPGEVWYHRDYFEKVNSLGCPVYVVTPVKEFANCVVYPRDEMMREFGPWVFTSSLSWMFAMAIMQPGIEEIALYGVDMSHHSEWEFQRSGCHSFIKEARDRGIRVTLPLESDLERPPALYGFQEHNHFYRKIRSRREELLAKVAECEQLVQSKRDELMYYKGALDDIEYQIRTWVFDPLQDELARKQPEPRQPEPAKVLASELNGHLNGHAEETGEEAAPAGQ